MADYNYNVNRWGILRKIGERAEEQGFFASSIFPLHPNQDCKPIYSDRENPYIVAVALSIPITSEISENELAQAIDKYGTELVRIVLIDEVTLSIKDITQDFYSLTSSFTPWLLLMGSGIMEWLNMMRATEGSSQDAITAIFAEIFFELIFRAQYIPIGDGFLMVCSNYNPNIPIETNLFDKSFFYYDKRAGKWYFLDDIISSAFINELPADTNLPSGRIGMREIKKIMTLKRQETVDVYIFGNIFCSWAVLHLNPKALIADAQIGNPGSFPRSLMSTVEVDDLKEEWERYSLAFITSGEGLYIWQPLRAEMAKPHFVHVEDISTGGGLLMNVLLQLRTGNDVSFLIVADDKMQKIGPIPIGTMPSGVINDYQTVFAPQLPPDYNLPNFFDVCKIHDKALVISDFSTHLVDTYGNIQDISEDLNMVFKPSATEESPGRFYLFPLALGGGNLYTSGGILLVAILGSLFAAMGICWRPLGRFEFFAFPDRAVLTLIDFTLIQNFYLLYDEKYEFDFQDFFSVTSLIYAIIEDIKGKMTLTPLQEWTAREELPYFKEKTRSIKGTSKETGEIVELLIKVDKYHFFPQYIGDFYFGTERSDLNLYIPFFEYLLGFYEYGEIPKLVKEKVPLYAEIRIFPSKDGIVLSWKKPILDSAGNRIYLNINAYKIYRAISSINPEFTLIDIVESKDINGEVNTLYYDTSTLEGVLYIYQVAAISYTDSGDLELARTKVVLGERGDLGTNIYSTGMEMTFKNLKDRNIKGLTDLGERILPYFSKEEYLFVEEVPLDAEKIVSLFVNGEFYKDIKVSRIGGKNLVYYNILSNLAKKERPNINYGDLKIHIEEKV